ncbi:MAG: DUF1919 domain-containing protein [Selenomonadaceae bacterium]|nr:DUF1919 domain-containing protein [Selenomonadaceae bacterium]
MTLPKLTGGGGDYEILAVGARKIGMNKVTQDARRLNLPEEKLLGDWIVTIPGFTLEKYRKLQRSRLSIFAMNCFGGVMSNTLGLPFRSPFVNNGIRNPNENIRFLSSPREYMEKHLILNKIVWQPVLKINYPIVTLGDVNINMSHYPDFDEAVAKWNERKQKINWYNICVTAYTEDKKILEQFDALPYGKKVCFVPFKSDLDSAWYINPEIKKGLEFWDIVNRFALGDPFYYDVFDMLLYGKKTPLIEM